MKHIFKILSIMLLIAICSPIALTQATNENCNHTLNNCDAPLVISAPLAEGIVDTSGLNLKIDSVQMQSQTRSISEGFDLNGFHYNFSTYVKTQGQQNVAAFAAVTNYTASEVAAHITTFQQISRISIL